MTGVFVKQEDKWEYVQAPQVQIDGGWRQCRAVFVKAGNEWHKVYHSAEIIMMPQRYVVTGVQDVCSSAA
jgi:hypothetical protein